MLRFGDRAADQWENFIIASTAIFAPIGLLSYFHLRLLGYWQEMLHQISDALELTSGEAAYPRPVSLRLVKGTYSATGAICFLSVVFSMKSHLHKIPRFALPKGVVYVLSLISRARHGFDLVVQRF